MRVAASLFLLVALLVAAGIWWRSDEAQPPAPGQLDAPGASAARRAAGPPAPSERSEVTPAPPPPTPSPAPASGEPAADQVPTAPTNVVLLVRDVAGREPVPAFRWRVRSGDDSWNGTGSDGRAELGLPADRRGELLVEADQFAPFVRAELATPSPGASPLQLDVFLLPAVPQAGITLHVHDLALQPIQNVRVDAFVLTAQNRDGAWHLGQPLWARRAGSATGTYTLPELPAGDYGVRLCATDADGNLLPLLPYSRTFALTGDHGFVEDVPLEPGCVLALELLDATGQAYDPTRSGTLTLALELPGGPAVQRRWSSRSGAVDATAIDVLPGVGGCELAEPIAAGNYTLELRVHGEPRARRSLVLRAGERQRERIQVP
jgi:hypothetical protein